MKKFRLFIIVFISVIVCSCGGGAGKTEQSSQTGESEKDKALYTKSGMIQKLQEMKIVIPEFLSYDTIIGEQIKFKAANVDEDLKQQLDEYYDKVCSHFRNAGWDESAEMTHNQNFGGIYKMGHRYKRPVGDGKFTEIIIVTTDYLEEMGVYYFSFQYHPKY